MKKLGILLALLAGTLTWRSSANSTTFLNWADEFASGQVYCQFVSLGGIAGNCTFQHNWTDQVPANTTGTNNTWSYVGAQGSSTQGRANAVEKIMFSISDRHSKNCGNVSVYMTRSRTTGAIPGEGASCTSGSQQFVGTAAYTYNTCAQGDQHFYESHGLLPAFNFSAEAGTPGTIGYHSRHMVYESVSNIFDWQDGCFKIQWL
ncbi:MAG: hypothetical protein JKY86_01220 [Gammaproteobacteria bacterium]|nr:hypothetical protein [Gammaproteobacteria bacterium]